MIRTIKSDGDKKSENAVNKNFQRNLQDPVEKSFTNVWISLCEFHRLVSSVLECWQQQHTNFQRRRPAEEDRRVLTNRTK